MRRICVAVSVLLVLPAAAVRGEAQAAHSADLPDDMRVYEVNKTVAEFPDVGDVSTPEAAYANYNRVSVSEDPNAWRAFSVKRVRDRLPAPETGKQEVRPEVVRRRLAARIVEVRVFRETYAVVLAETRMKFHAEPDERTVIDVRHLELEDGQWLNVGQDVVDSVDRGRLIFARVCAGHIGKPTRPKVDDPEASLKPFVEFLKTHGEDPKAFVMKALATHKVVIMGEVHHRPRYWAFNAALVQDPEFAKSVGTIYMELPSNDQGLVDTFLATEELDTTPVIEMLRDNLWMGWPDQAMLDFFVTVWTVNQELAPEQRLRIVLADMQRPWKEIKRREDSREYDVDRDKFMAERILADRSRHPDEKRHGLFIVGVGHAMLDLNAPTYPPMPDPIETAGWHLLQALGRDNVYAIFQHTPVQTNMGRVDGRLCLGLFDSAFAATGNQPIAFPLDTGPFGEQPFDAMPDVQAAGSYRDGYDAYLYLGPLEEESFSPLIPGFYTDEFVKELDRRYRMMYGKGLVEAGIVKNLDAESFIAWMSRGWGQPRREWGPQRLGPLNAWHHGDAWQKEISDRQEGSVFEHPEAIVAAAQSLFAAIRKADYDHPGDWREFLGPSDPYCAGSGYDRWVAWVCKTFKENPIQTVDLGQPSKNGAGRPSIPYKLTLSGGKVLEGVLPFRYNAFAQCWQGVGGLDWHLIEPSLDLSPASKQSP